MYGAFLHHIGVVRAMIFSLDFLKCGDPGMFKVPRFYVL